MNDASKDPSRDLMMKLHWPPDEGVAAEGHCVVVELQCVDGLALASISVSSEQLLQAVAQKLAHYPLISPDGFVSIASDESSAPSPLKAGATYGEKKAKN